MLLSKAISFLAGFSLLLFIAVPTLAGEEQMYGTWRLVSFKRTILATGETTDIFGKSPHGFINYGRDGRMLPLFVSDKRPKPTDLGKMTDQERVELFKTTIAYGGTYTYDGKTITHHVDVSWNENWTGTDLVREVKFDGTRLILSTVPAPSAIDGKLVTSVLTWERVQ